MSDIKHSNKEVLIENNPTNNEVIEAENSNQDGGGFTFDESSVIGGQSEVRGYDETHTRPNDMFGDKISDFVGEMEGGGENHFDFIIDPNNNKKYPIYSTEGKNLLKYFINLLNNKN